MDKHYTLQNGELTLPGDLTMQVEAIYNQGAIHLVHPLRLKHNHIRLTLIVPDEEVETDGIAPVTAADDSMETRVRAILRPYQQLFDRAVSQAPLDYDSIRDEYLADKYMDSK